MITRFTQVNNNINIQTFFLFFNIVIFNNFLAHTKCENVKSWLSRFIIETFNFQLVKNPDIKISEIYISKFKTPKW